MAIPPCPTTLPDPTLAQSFVTVTNGGSKKGSGILMASRWILTAAHVAHFATRVTKGNSTRRIARKLRLVDYDSKTHFNDLAMVELWDDLPGAVPFASNIGKVEIGNSVELFGLHINACQPPGRLRSCQTNVIDTPAGNQHLADRMINLDPNDCFFTDQLVGVAGGTSSGGPVFNAARELVGIINVGDPDDDPSDLFPNRHTRVATYSTRIEDLIKNVSTTGWTASGVFFNLKARFLRMFWRPAPDAGTPDG